MKRIISIVFIAVMLTMISNLSLAEIQYDISAFDDPLFDIQIDEMDDTGTIELADSKGSAFAGSGDNDDGGVLIGEIDIRIVEDFPPVMRLTFIYSGEKWCFVEKMIIKTDASRYTFNVSHDTEMEGSRVYEMFTIILTDQSIKMIQDILEAGSTLAIVKYRMVGSERDIDGNLLVMNLEEIKKLYDAYVASGALENDFTAVDSMNKVTIK